MTNKISIIIAREYSERVKKKSFIITTILVPVLMLALSVLPAAIMMFASGDEKTIAVVDDSGLVFGQLTDTDEIKFVEAFAPQDDMLANEDTYGVLIIDRNIMKKPSGLRLLTANAASIQVERTITDQIESILEKEKLKAYDIEDLDRILQEVKTEVSMQTIRTDRGDDGESQSAAISSAIGTVLNFLLYMFLLM
ncbi:MAG: ABC transporter permease [Muribaculaceae bacterium]|nr:ABC transporter permease [Muribaculaceae bacterium]